MCCIFDGCQVDRRQPLGESDLLLRAFYAFLQTLPTQDNKEPLLLRNFLERLDESVDLQPIFQALRTTGRQVFLIVSENYLIEKIEGKEGASWQQNGLKMLKV